jgi:hypothetical protein
MLLIKLSSLMCRFDRDRNLQLRYKNCRLFFPISKKIMLLKVFVAHEIFIAMDKKRENFKHSIQL